MSDTKQIEGFSGYCCDALGNFYSTKWNKFVPMKLKKDRYGYLIVQLSNGPIRKFVSAHSLVLSSWISPRPHGYQCNHKNGVRDDNRVENLEWVTPLENTRHSHKVLGKDMRGSGHVKSKIKEKDAIEIRRLRAEGHTLISIGKKFGIGISTVYNITSGNTWKHV